MNNTNNNSVSFPVLGQPLATAQIENLLNAFIRNDERGGLHKPWYVHGPSGVGKSFTLQALGDLIESKTGYTKIYIPSGTPIALMEDFRRVILGAAEGGRCVFIFDECHTVVGSSQAEITVTKNVSDTVKGFFKELGNGTPAYADFRRIGEANGLLSLRDHLFIFATSKVELMETKGDIEKDDSTNERRLSEVELLHYKNESMPEVISAFLKYHGLKAADCSKGLIANYHRNSLEALGKIIDRFKEKFPGVSILSKEKVIESAKLTRFLPLGYTRKEGTVLRAIKENNGKIEIETLKKSVPFASFSILRK